LQVLQSDAGCWRLTGGGIFGGVHDCLKVINVILRGFWAKFSAGTPDGADTGRNGREAALGMTTLTLNPSPC
jgi:hypothetical protein